MIFRHSIIDKGGEDTLDFSALNQGTYVNLSPNTWSSMQFTGDEAQFSSENNWVYEKGDLYISEHTEIENVVGTNSNDIICANVVFPSPGGPNNNNVFALDLNVDVDVVILLDSTFK